MKILKWFDDFIIQINEHFKQKPEAYRAEWFSIEKQKSGNILVNSRAKIIEVTTGGDIEHLSIVEVRGVKLGSGCRAENDGTVNLSIYILDRSGQMIAGAKQKIPEKEYDDFEVIYYELLESVKAEFKEYLDDLYAFYKKME